MKRIRLFLYICIVVTMAHAQRITQSYNNVSLSDALSQLAEQQTDYTMHVWMPYTNYSLTAIYRLGDFKEKKKKKVDTSRMGY